MSVNTIKLFNKKTIQFSGQKQSKVHQRDDHGDGLNILLRLC